MNTNPSLSFVDGPETEAEMHAEETRRAVEQANQKHDEQKEPSHS